MVQKVAILGATGVVGQKAVALLSRHPHFIVSEVVASEKRVGQTFKEICDWREPMLSLPTPVADLKCQSYESLKADWVISCLPSNVAAVVEPILVNQGKWVFSNAACGRMLPEIPLIVPEVNAVDFSLLEKATQGQLIKNPNCSVVGIVLALAPLFELGVIEHVSLVTLQSMSGAGYHGLSGMMIVGNTCPHIVDEVHKIETETKKILRHFQMPEDWAITAHVHRVPVLYGHSATLHIQFKDTVDLKAVERVYLEWNKRFPHLFVLHKTLGRPQPMCDLTSDDMRLHIGHIRLGGRSNILGMTILSHNLVRGAAGAAIANMEAYKLFLNQS